MRACECIICDNRPLSLCHEPPNDPFEKAQKEPHGSFEVICGSSEHDIYRVSEKTLVEVPSQTMVALASTTVLSLIPVILLLLVLHGKIDVDAFLEAPRPPLRYGDGNVQARMRRKVQIY